MEGESKKQEKGKGKRGEKRGEDRIRYSEIYRKDVEGGKEGKFGRGEVGNIGGRKI